MSMSAGRGANIAVGTDDASFAERDRNATIAHGRSHFPPQGHIVAQRKCRIAVRVVAKAGQAGRDAVASEIGGQVNEIDGREPKDAQLLDAEPARAPTTSSHHIRRGSMTFRIGASGPDMPADRFRNGPKTDALAQPRADIDPTVRDGAQGELHVLLLLAGGEMDCQALVLRGEDVELLGFHAVAAHHDPAPRTRRPR